MILLAHASHSRFHCEELPPIRLLRVPALKLSRNLFVQLKGSTRHHLNSFRCFNTGSYSNTLSLISPLPTSQAESETPCLPGDKEAYLPNKQALDSKFS